MFHRLLLSAVCVFLSCNSCAHENHEHNINGHNNRKLEENSCAVAAGIPYWDQDRAFASFRQNVGLVDQIYVFWYNLGRDGKVHKYISAKENSKIIEYAHQHGTRVFALVANLPDDQREGEGDWDPRRVGRMLNSPAHRRFHIAELLALTERLPFDGIHIDYEALPANYRKKFTLFIRELSEALHKRNKQLAVAIHPKTSVNNPDEDNGSHAQDYAELAKYADQLHIMTYNEYTGSATPGPPASPGWVSRVLRYAVNEGDIPRNKLFFGIPLYAEVWEKRGKDYHQMDIDLTFNDIEKLEQRHGVREKWSEEYATPFITYRSTTGAKRIAWFENQKSVAHMLKLGSQLQICNIVLWRLGGEDSGVWQSLRQAGY
jgi:spore germination protein